MREKYESLALAELRAIAKSRGMKRISGLKKAELVELMLEEDEKDKEAGKDVEPKPVLRGMKEPSFATAANKNERRNKLAKPQNAEGQSAENSERPAKEQAAESRQQTEVMPERQTERPAERPSERPAREQTEGRSSDEKFPSELDSGLTARVILEVMPDGFGFIRSDNFLPGENDVYVAPSQIRRFGLRTGDIIEGNTRIKTMNEKFSALLYLKKVNGLPPELATRRRNFEDMTPIFPDQRIRLETPGASVAMRIMDLMRPVGKGQRGMIVSPPKAGKTTLLKEVAKSILKNAPDMHMIILFID